MERLVFYDYTKHIESHFNLGVSYEYREEIRTSFEWLKKNYPDTAIIVAIEDHDPSKLIEDTFRNLDIDYNKSFSNDDENKDLIKNANRMIFSDEIIYLIKKEDLDLFLITVTEVIGKPTDVPTNGCYIVHKG